MQYWNAVALANGNPVLRNPHTLFLQFMSVYVILLCVSAALSTGLFRLLSYVIAIFMPIVLAIRFSGSREKNILAISFALPLLLYYYGMFGSVAYNFKELDWPVTIKFVLAPLFLLLGAKVESWNSPKTAISPKTWAMFGLIILLPLVVLLLQLVKGVNVFARGADFSIFANRNSAALYAVALLGLFTVFARRTPTNVLVYLAVGASFATLGVLIAIIFSLMLLVAKRENLIRYTAGLVATAASITVLAINDVWVFARFKPAIGTLELLFDPRVHFASLSYERLYHYLGTSDLSLAFRIKHWHDLMDILASAPVFNWVFGMGIGASTRLSQAMMVPHNDYLRIFFECGIATFVGFASLLTVMLIKLGRGWKTVPFLAIVLYMASENLVDNFPAMVIFYYAGGVLIYRQQRAEQTHAICPEQSI